MSLSDDEWKSLCHMMAASHDVNRIRKKSKKLDREVGAYICMRDGTPDIGKICVGEQGSIDPRKSTCRGGKVIGAVHTHPHRKHPRVSLPDIQSGMIMNQMVECVIAIQSGTGACYHLNEGSKRRFEELMGGNLYRRIEGFVDGEGEFHGRASGAAANFAIKDLKMPECRFMVKRKAGMGSDLRKLLKGMVEE
jgi:proteasome lid subunit RPN8/RPN11